jgi:hypothetical protein
LARDRGSPEIKPRTLDVRAAPMKTVAIAAFGVSLFLAVAWVHEHSVRRLLL